MTYCPITLHLYNIHHILYITTDMVLGLKKNILHTKVYTIVVCCTTVQLYSSWKGPRCAGASSADCQRPGDSSFDWIPPSLHPAPRHGSTFIICWFEILSPTPPRHRSIPQSSSVEMIIPAPPPRHCIHFHHLLILWSIIISHTTTIFQNTSTHPRPLIGLDFYVG